MIRVEPELWQHLKARSACRYHDDKLAIVWSLTVDENGTVTRIVPLCTRCGEGYEDLMRKTYGDGKPYHAYGKKRVVERR